jgi:arylsulfatase A
MQKPNILLMLADDLGFGDLGCYGNPVIKTPSLDRLASEGVRFTQCYAASPNCSPARAGILTGRMPYRVGMYDFVRRDAPLHLPTEETSVASMLRAAGYQTMFCGKWHLGNFQKHPDAYPTPGDHGFDYWLANEHNFDMNPKDLWRNGAPAGPLDGIQSTVLVHECIDWLETERDPEKPFCMFLFLNEPHSPVRADEKFKSMYVNCDAAASRIKYGGNGVEREKADPLERPTYFGCVSQMDHEVGRLVAAVDRLGLKKDTFVMFTSDNGPEHRLPTSWGSPGNLRGAKGHMHDGGIHVPGIMRWPGKLEAGTESSLPINGTDLLPTFCAMAYADILTEKVVDGVDLLPTLLEDKQVERRIPLFWWLYHARGGKQACMREGDWKMLARMTPQLDPSIQDAEPPEGQTRMEFIKHTGLEDFELYNLRDDPSEKMDVSQEEPDRFDAMRLKMIALHKEIRSEGPVWPSITTGGGGI